MKIPTWMLSVEAADARIAEQAYLSGHALQTLADLLAIRLPTKDNNHDNLLPRGTGPQGGQRGSVATSRREHEQSNDSARRQQGPQRGNRFDGPHSRSRIPIQGEKVMNQALCHPKVKQEHLCRKAVVYIRQSSDKQVRQNKESQHLQYDVAERMRGLGWKYVEIIDDDLGCSAGLAATRLGGFERVLSSVALGEVGIVGSWELSTLSRTDKGWYRLDVGVLATAIVTLSVAACLAGALPARRAASIDPVRALRTE